MKLFLSILFSSLFIAPIMHGMYPSAERRGQRNSNPNHALEPDEDTRIKDFVDKLKKQFDETGGKGISLENYQDPLGGAIYFNNAVLAEQVINRCSLAQLNRTLGYPYPGMTPLQYAARTGNKKIVILLLAAQVNVNRKKFYQTALSLATLAGWIDIADLLLDAGATVQFTVLRETFVEYVVKSQAQCMVECLVARNLIPEDLANYPKVIEAKKMQDRLNKAVEQDNATELIKCLKEDAYQNGLVREYIFQKLSSLVAKDDLVSLRRLIIQGFPLFISDKQGNTLLHVAVQNCSVRTIGYFIALLKKIGKLDQYAFKRNNSGRTAIDYAVEDEQRQQLFKLFLGLEDSKPELDLNLPADAAQLPVSASNSNSGWCVIS